MIRHLLTLATLIILTVPKITTLGQLGHNDIYKTIKMDNNRRNAKRQQQSYPQSPIIDLLMQSISPNYAANNPTDLFDILRDKYTLPNGLKSPYTEYDYVIVGAGSAGSVLAARLSENPNVTVLLLEAGKPETITTDVPAIAPYFQRTEYAWPYYMDLQPGVCLGMINKRCFWPRGRAVGGTSVINYMIYTRGRPEEWNRIADAGNYGWSYNEVLKYFKKSERSSIKDFKDSPYRGEHGEINIEFVPIRTPLIEAFLEAGRQLGSPTVDYNAPERLGFGYVQTTTINGKRISAAKAFLHYNKNRPNLHVMPMSRVTKINIESKTANGVQYVRNRLKYEVKARREVILSAGPIASPQLLMLSGIGPKNHLSKVGIQVIKDLPVGRTLYDHITFPGIIFSLNTSGVTFNENRQANIENVLRWIQYGDSPVATPGAVEGIGYIRTNVTDEPKGIPDIELISIGGSLVSDGGPGGSKAVRRGMSISEETFNIAFGSIDNTDTWSAFPMLLHPKSVGYLELKDNNPLSYPRLVGNYLNDTGGRDIASFVASIRHVQALAATKPFQSLGARLHRARYPACLSTKFNSDEYWECAVRTLTATLHHQIATCRMGSVNDPLAVVDPELRVHGIQRLRVIDSSIIPKTIAAHTHAPAVMIGEKGADMIKSTWN